MTDEPQIEIYALCCPDTNKVMYIGKARCSKKRLLSHLREKRRLYPVYLWINHLASIGKSPSLKVLQICPESEWKEAEKYHIEKYKKNGDLLNVAKGGSEPHCPAKTRALNGRKNAEKIHSDPKRKRIWELKRSIGQALKNGELKEHHKAKLRLAAKKSPELFGEYAKL